MIKNNEIANYVICGLCFEQLIKPGHLCCKKCQVKTRSNKVSNCKVYKINFKNSNSSTEVLNVTKQYINSKYYSNALDDKSALSLIKYTHQAENIYNYEWSKFKKVEELGSFIINSNQFPILDFIYKWGDDLKSIPRIQSFMNDHRTEPKEGCSKSKSILISAVARPLLLVSQEGFWAGLMKAYFKGMHAICTLFSLVNFDPKTTPDSLLSAIYFAGFVIQPNYPDEIRTYMLAYAVTNIKKILLSVKISSAQALGLYSYALYVNGNSSLSRACLSHFARMNHALGIRINRKNLPIIDQYNRKLININMKLYCNWVKLGPSSYDVVSEDESDDLCVYGSKYQFPNSSLNLYNTDFEAALYPVFCCQFAKLVNLSITNNSIFSKFDYNRNEIEELKNKVDEIYNDAKLTLQSVINLAPEYKNQTSIYLDLLKAPYIACTLSIHSKIFKISKSGDYSITQAMLDKASELWDLINSNRTFTDIWSLGLYTVGFYLIQIYPNCTKKQKKSVRFILKSIIHLFYNEGHNLNTMNFLILKTQFNLINID